MSAQLTLDPAQIPAYGRVFLLEEVGSTNDEATRLLTDPDALVRRSLSTLSLVSTGNQTAGRGRLDRAWTAPAGASLSTSFLVRPHADARYRMNPDSYHWFTLLGALAVVRTLETLGLKGAALKWPNDVLVGEKKICGILAKLVLEPEGQFSLVLGIGLNLNMRAEEVPVPTATSLLLETGQTVELGEVLKLLAQNFELLARALMEAGGDPARPLAGGASLLDRARARMVTLGQKVRVHLPGEEVMEGLALDINEEGELLVRGEDQQVQAYSVGDIVHLRPAPAEDHTP